MYDIIGDVHGYAPMLKKLLLKMGYKKTQSGYFHPSRKAIFVGDFINRGPEIRKTIRIIRSMVESGNALAILGNHEINALFYFLKDKKGTPLVKSTEKNFMSLYKTINEFANSPDEWKSHRKWLRGLPLFLNLNEIRVVHACWSDAAIQRIVSENPMGNLRKKVLREIFNNPKSELSKSISTITRGIDFKMPGDLRIVNNKGIAPRSFRLRWWENPTGKTFEEMSFESKYILPDYEIPKKLTPSGFIYSGKEPLLFFGHYCRFKGPHIVKPNICCVDSCITRNKTLTAYRWSGEKQLTGSNLIQARK